MKTKILTVLASCTVVFSVALVSTLFILMAAGFIAFPLELYGLVDMHDVAERTQQWWVWIPGFMIGFAFLGSLIRTLNSNNAPRP